MTMLADFKSLLVRDEESSCAVKFDLSSATVAESWGLWVSEGGSLYLFDGSRFVCVEVHSGEYRGWVGKTAVDDVHRISDSFWSGVQAFRCKATGTLTNWVPITLTFEKNLVTKYFPGNIPRSLMVYGPVERYVRASSRHYC